MACGGGGGGGGNDRTGEEFSVRESPGLVLFFFFRYTRLFFFDRKYVFFKRVS